MKTNWIINVLELGYSTLHRGAWNNKYFERNFLGKGAKYYSRYILAGNQNLTNFNFTEPRFMDTPVSAGFDIYGNETDYSEQSGYKE